MTERKYFTRILVREQVDTLVDLLRDAGKESFDYIGDREMMTIKAPDGDTVLAVLKMNERTYICRLHKDVFDEDSAQGAKAP